jgi:hypothetical protein
MRGWYTFYFWLKSYSEECFVLKKVKVLLNVLSIRELKGKIEDYDVFFLSFTACLV